MVDFERDRPVGVPVDDRALSRPDHDGVGQHGEVDRDDHRAVQRPERDPADPAGRDQPTALGRPELADDPQVGGTDTVPGRHAGASAEERGRRGLQGGRELPELRRGGPGRVALQVLQVPQVQPGARGHLHLAQVQFGASLRDPLAEVARVRAATASALRPSGRSRICS